MPSAAGAYGNSLEGYMLQREKSAMEQQRLEMEQQKHAEQMQGDREDRELRRQLMVQSQEDRRQNQADRLQLQRDKLKTDEETREEKLATMRTNRYEKTTGGMNRMDYMTTDLQQMAVDTGNERDLVNPPQWFADEKGQATIGTPPLAGVMAGPPQAEDLIKNKIPLFFRGSPAQVDAAAKAAEQKRLIGQSGSLEEQRRLELQAAGLPQPASAAESAITLRNFHLDGAPNGGNIVGQVGRNGRVTYQGQDVTDRVTPYQAPSQAQDTAAMGGFSSSAEILPGTDEFVVAQDLAYGKLTYAQFQRLIAYNRNSNAKFALYSKASGLNPNFNPAAFESGFKLASNPRVQQQLASMDNVMSAVPDLLAISDAAQRSGLTKLNEWTSPIKVAIGRKQFTNLAIVRTGFADELSGALGFGSATDMSRQMGYDMTNPNLSPENFKAGINEVVIPFLQRKRQALLDQMGIYGQPDMNPAAVKGAADAAAGGIGPAAPESAWDRYQKAEAARKAAAAAAAGRK